MIILQDFGREDFDQLIGWLNNEDLLMNWSGALFKYPLTHESLEWYITDTNNAEDPSAYVYKAVDSETGETVGHISLGGISEKNNSARISRVLVGEGSHRGKGYCTDMVKEIIAIGFEKLKLHRISLGVYDTNISAVKCYEKAGFIKEGVFRDVLYHHGSYWSMIEMSILEHEWRTHLANTKPAGNNL